MNPFRAISSTVGHEKVQQVGGTRAMTELYHQEGATELYVHLDTVKVGNYCAVPHTAHAVEQRLPSL